MPKWNYKITTYGVNFIKLAPKWSSLNVDGELLIFFSNNSYENAITVSHVKLITACPISMCVKIFKFMRVLIVALWGSHTLERTRLSKRLRKSDKFLRRHCLDCKRIASSVFLRNHLMTFLVPLFFKIIPLLLCVKMLKAMYAMLKKQAEK